MADFVVPILVENLIKLLTYEANLLLGVEDGFISLKDDLEFMNVFLQKSAEKRNDNYVKVLVNQIRDVALDSEDVVDTYVGRLIKQRRRNLVGKLFHIIGHASVLQGVANQTSSIKQRIQDIYENKARYGIEEAGQSSIDVETQQSIQKRRRNVEEDDVVGFVKDTTTLVNQLTDQRNLQRKVISILGMGGLGKTTLARKIYNNSTIKNRFDCSGWIFVPQEFQIKILLLDLLKSFEQITKMNYMESSKMNNKDETSKKTVEDLKDELHGKLKGKRYFIVIDDIWSTQVWEELRAVFPDDSNGSRILITTRQKEVAGHASPTPPHELRFLDENESWELLQKKAFRDGQGLPNLEEPGRELAKSCRGLPLSIVLLGGILAAKEKSHRVWSRFVGNVNSYLTEGVSILKLSYNHLPRELKSCFLYLSLFPEDSEIKVRDLIEFWIAEGFIESHRNKSIYDVAEDYLEKLIDRSMIQVATKRSNGGVKTCRIHDLLQGLCTEESRRDKLFDSYSIDNNVSLNTKSRRVSIQHISESHFDLPSCARSLFFFGVGTYPLYKPVPKSVWKQIYKCTKFIRVLYLFGLKIKKIPSQIDELIFLRCLFIKECEVDNVSSSIWNFQYLETVHLVCFINGKFPKGIWSVMKELRNVYVHSQLELDLSYIPQRRLMGEPFRNLQVLSWLVVKQNTALVIDKFPNLRKLGLHFGKKETEESVVEKVMASIGRLESLQSFKVRGFFRTYNQVGTRLNFLPSALTKISWASETFDWDMFKVLARQPNLRVLKINMWYESPQQPHELSVVAGDFPQLQVLKLSNLKIKTWEMEKHAMPNLHSLFIHRCAYLEYLPEEELLCRTTLQLVQVSGMEVQNKLKTMLKNFKIIYHDTPCKINIIEFKYP